MYVYMYIYTYLRLLPSFMLCYSYCILNLISGKQKRQRKQSSDLESDSDSMSPANYNVYEVPITLESLLCRKTNLV